MYKDFSGDYQKELTAILAMITHHTHPDVVKLIEEDNARFKEQFEIIKHQNCSSEAFLYHRSDCVFPGFRRPINREKHAGWKNNVYDDGTILNDNTFPRHIWAYLAENRAYAGGAAGMWARSGLDRFELAHIFAHKADERSFERKMFGSVDDTVEPYGLFTSASNVVLIPKGFAKPTDHMDNVKACFYKRHLDLYGNNLIGLRDFNESLLPEWHTEIKWVDPVLPDNWKFRTQNLLKYRDKYLRNKYA
jgi:hypothetical protein